MNGSNTDTAEEDCDGVAQRVVLKEVRDIGSFIHCVRTKLTVRDPVVVSLCVCLSRQIVVSLTHPVAVHRQPGFDPKRAILPHQDALERSKLARQNLARHSRPLMKDRLPTRAT